MPSLRISTLSVLLCLSWLGSLRSAPKARSTTRAISSLTALVPFCRCIFSAGRCFWARILRFVFLARFYFWISRCSCSVSSFAATKLSHTWITSILYSTSRWTWCFVSHRANLTASSLLLKLAGVSAAVVSPTVIVTNQCCSIASRWFSRAGPRLCYESRDSCRRSVVLACCSCFCRQGPR